MPEFRESLAHYLYLLVFYNFNKQSNWMLLALWADLTDPEVKRTGKGKNGCVQRLDSTCSLKRGSKGGQTDLYPPTLRQTKKKPGEPLETFSLTELGHTPWAIILIFGLLYLKLAYLTHTSVQCFTREQWETSIQTVPKSDRGKVGLAIEFQDFFIVFISHDLVFQPEWSDFCPGVAKDPSVVPYSIPVPLYDDYAQFLRGVSDWIKQRASGTTTRRGLACESMRSAQDAWFSVGIYTVSEIFFDAGVSPFLTEAEVFDCPSRTARLCDAFYCFAVCSRDNLMSLLSPCIVNGVLAPTQDQRLKYINWLHIYAKDKTTVPARMATLVDRYHETLNIIEHQPSTDNTNNPQDQTLYDIFNPHYLRAAFNRDHLNLGSIIFGEYKWIELGGQPSLPNPLSNMFLERGISNQRTPLDLDHYTTLYPNELDGRRQCPSYAYHAKKQIWSITRASIDLPF